MMFSLWRIAIAYKISSFNDSIAKMKFITNKVDSTAEKPFNKAISLNENINKESKI